MSSEEKLGKMGEKEKNKEQKIAPQPRKARRPGRKSSTTATSKDPEKNAEKNITDTKVDPVDMIFM